MGASRMTEQREGETSSCVTTGSKTAGLNVSELHTGRYQAKIEVTVKQRSEKLVCVQQIHVIAGIQGSCEIVILG